MQTVKRFIISRIGYCVCSLAVMVLFCLYINFLIGLSNGDVDAAIILGITLVGPFFVVFDVMLFLFITNAVRLAVALSSRKRCGNDYREIFYTKRFQRIICLVLAIVALAMWILGVYLVGNLDEIWRVIAFFCAGSLVVTIPFFILSLYRAKTYEKTMIFAEFEKDEK